MGELDSHFDPNSNIADHLIMYEITGHKNDDEFSKEFWEQYAAEGSELGNFTKAVQPINGQ